MASMQSIINEIKGLDKYVKAMKKCENRETKIQDLDNLLMHINNLKAWAGLNSNVNTGALPTPNNYDSIRHRLIGKACSLKVGEHNTRYEVATILVDTMINEGII